MKQHLFFSYSGDEKKPSCSVLPFTNGVSPEKTTTSSHYEGGKEIAFDWAMIEIWTKRLNEKNTRWINFETWFIFAETSSTNTVCTSSSTTSSSASSDLPLGRSNGIDQSSQGRPTVNGVDQSQGRPTVNGVVDQSFVSNSDVADLQTESTKNEGKVLLWLA